MFMEKFTDDRRDGNRGYGFGRDDRDRGYGGDRDRRDVGYRLVNCGLCPNIGNGRFI